MCAPVLLMHSPAYARGCSDWDEEWEDEANVLEKRDPGSIFRPITSQMSLFGGTSHPLLARGVADALGMPLSQAKVSRFLDGEVTVHIIDSVRGKDVYIVHPVGPPINDNLIELLLFVSALRRADAGRITAVIPYYGYARQDRKRAARETIAAADIARMLEAVGIDQVVAVDLHRGQVQGFFDARTPCENLSTLKTVALPQVIKRRLYRPVVVSPSNTGTSRAIQFRKDLRQQGLESGFAVVVAKDASGREVVGDEHQGHHHKVHGSSQMELVGEVRGCDVIIVDDMVDTGSRMILAAETAKKYGANRVIGLASHGLFSTPNAVQDIEESCLDEVIVCDTIPMSRERFYTKNKSKIKYISIATELAEAILRLHKRIDLDDMSVGS